MFLPLGDGPGTMHQLYTDGLAKMQAGDIDARTGAATDRALSMAAGGGDSRPGSVVVDQRAQTRATLSAVYDRRPAPGRHRTPLASAALLFSLSPLPPAAAPGLDEYRKEKFREAYDGFQETLKEYPDTKAADKIQFDAGAAAYKMKDYGKALQSFSQALLSPDRSLQSRSHYNLGNTLYQHGEAQEEGGRKTEGLDERAAALRADPEDRAGE